MAKADNPYVRFSRKWWAYWPYYLKCLVWHRYHVVKCDLSPTYHDPNELLLYASFAIFCNFVENEAPFDHIDWNHDAHHRAIGDEIVDLYDWWIHRRPARIRAEARSLNDWHAEFSRNGGGLVDVVGNQWISPDDPYTSALSLLHHKYEEWGRQEDEKQLIRLAKIRNYLWT